MKIKHDRHLPGRLPRTLVRMALFAALWWILTAGDRESWIVGGPAVVLAGFFVFSLAGSTPWRWRLKGLARFLPFFMWRSFVGGIDVARRALHPDRPLVPGFVDYRMGLPQDTARVFMINTVSLLPGTLSAEISEGKLIVHVLDTGLPVLAELKTIESRVADLFGLQVDGGVDKMEDGVD